ncbi:leucine-rich repeat domain-containing protein [Ascoidea rubescens DSM 1968]|uniref:L domain-like protein n=1 Tax=Ascoidea rubescens DSM 1968 TaxID=1344418 RepID=A0A1D2VHJ8_9ASCO|nr:L domain-like protein [Ascoidea rubescens DSM 1968]ODV61128.1 L domain-like protein [Ascoidea rubescens DSM 1968]
MASINKLSMLQIDFDHLKIFKDQLIYFCKKLRIIFKSANEFFSIDSIDILQSIQWEKLDKLDSFELHVYYGDLFSETLFEDIDKMTGLILKSSDNLRKIKIRYNYPYSNRTLKFLNELKYCLNLRALDLEVCRLPMFVANDIEFLGNCNEHVHNNLNRLKLNFERNFLSLEYLINFKNLKDLCIICDTMPGIFGVWSLSMLKKLSIYGHKIIQIQNLDGLSNLQCLSIISRNITKIENLNHLITLKILSLSNSRIIEINNLDNLINLEELWLSFNCIRKIEKLDKLTKLTKLVLNHNSIAKIENLERLTNLKHLDLTANEIENIENLDNLTSLANLDLSQNRIKKIRGLSSLVNLVNLNLSFNRIDKIENLSTLVDLTHLNLLANDIRKIMNLSRLKNLTYLKLDHNYNLGTIGTRKLKKLKDFKVVNQIDRITKVILNTSNNSREIKIGYVHPNFNRPLGVLNELKYCLNLNALDLRVFRFAEFDAGDFGFLDNLNGQVYNNLNRLRLGFSRDILSPRSLAKFKNLKDFTITCDKVPKIFSKRKFPLLKSITIIGIQEVRINNLDGLTDLQYLYIRHGDFAERGKLNGLIGLRTLIFHNCLFREINYLNKPINLEELSSSSSSIDKIENLNKLTKLKKLTLNYNPITRIENLERLSCLRYLNLSNNII